MVFLYPKGIAYDRYSLFIKQESCPICLFKYKNDDNISILICGHTFHTSCIDNNEYIKWRDAAADYPHSVCPICRKDYRVDVDKYQFNKNYDDLIYSSSFPGAILLQKYIWDNIGKDYDSHVLYIQNSMTELIERLYEPSEIYINNSD